MDLSVATAFAGVSILFVLTPGADWAYAIAAGLRHRSVVSAVVGMLAGHLLATLIVAGGVGALVARLPFALALLTGVGAAYLLWLGYRTWTAPSTIRAGEADDDAGALRNAVAGFGVSGLNPKVVLLFIALLPQFAREEAALPMWAQMLALGGIHLVNTAVVYFAVAASAKAILRSRPAVATAVSRASGAIMMALGGFLLLEQFHLA